MKKNLLALSATVLCLSSGVANAEPYVLAGFGTGHINVDCSGFGTCDNNGTAYKLIGGWELARGWAVELGYLGFGKSTTQGYGGSSEIKASAVTLGAAYQVAFGHSAWGLNTRLGVADVKTEVNAVGLNNYSNFVVYTDSQTKAKLYAGVGVNYAVALHTRIELGIDLSQAQYQNQKGGTQALTLGVRQSF
ncbi:MAG: porin family protein [Paucibacter sp.]|nr:porin family protein [Roseateles sp.]